MPHVSFPAPPRQLSVSWGAAPPSRRSAPRQIASPSDCGPVAYLYSPPIKRGLNFTPTGPSHFHQHNPNMPSVSVAVMKRLFSLLSQPHRAKKLRAAACPLQRPKFFATQHFFSGHVPAWHQGRRKNVPEGNNTQPKIPGSEKALRYPNDVAGQHLHLLTGRIFDLRAGTPCDVD